MSTARLALSSIFTLAANTAISATTLIDAANVGASKVKLFADDSLLEQRMRSHGNRADLKERIQRDLTRRRADMNLQTLAYLNGSAEQKQAYEEAEKHYEKLWEGFAD